MNKTRETANLIDRLINATSPLSGGGDLTVDRTIVISQASSSTDGYLSAADWNAFNNKPSVSTGGNLFNYYNFY